MPEARKRRRQIHPLRDALLAGICTFIVSAVGLTILYLKAHDAQVGAVRIELMQLARATAAQIDGNLLKTLVSPEQEGSPEHLRALEPIVRMHRATHDIYYTYTGVYREGRIYWVLDGAKLYRVPGNDLAPDPIMTLYKVRDADYEAAFRDGKEFIDPEPRPYADGHKYLSAAAPIRDSAGRLVGMFGLDMVTDKLDERVAGIQRVLGMALAVVTLLSIGARLAHLLHDGHRELAQLVRDGANRAKATFLAMMSHEIRTPMNGMLGVADLLRNMSPDAAQKRLLDILSSSGESLLRIINDILDFSKIEAEKLELRPRPFELRGLLEELTALLSTQADGKQISFVLDADPQLPAAVIGDRQRLSQVLLNLGNNAVKFTDQGEVRLIVRLHGCANGKATLQFTVRDTGIGMSSEAMTKLFMPFTQLAEARQHRGGGTGLGLVISQKLVKLMGGDISVASEPGHGSSFSFGVELPTAEISASSGTHKVLSVESLSILVAEDNVVNQTIIQAMLKQLGHEVRLANDGREALEALAQQSFDLVLMDCNMPVMGGLEATQRLRAGTGSVRDSDVPVIALTANAMDGDREACLAAGMNDFLAKPVSIATLRQAIERVRGAAGTAPQFKRAG